MKNTANWVRRLAYIQIITQVGMVLTPFWATTVQAAILSPPAPDDRLLN